MAALDLSRTQRSVDSWITDKPTTYDPDEPDRLLGQIQLLLWDIPFPKTV
jgi:hypothetical protein